MRSAIVLRIMLCLELLTNYSSGYAGQNLLCCLTASYSSHHIILVVSFAYYSSTGNSQILLHFNLLFCEIKMSNNHPNGVGSVKDKAILLYILHKMARCIVL